jgi:hypothetical protein
MYILYRYLNGKADLVLFVAASSGVQLICSIRCPRGPPHVEGCRFRFGHDFSESIDHNTLVYDVYFATVVISVLL